ncbi:MAG: hypothetical protein LBV08_00375 [Clostridiales bacterium]|nr:hypothetical protein [Clostridiales bacterium]
MLKTNFIFIGEAGSGKSEIAINIARLLAGLDHRPVNFFDMDMTKPLFRSRDMRSEIEAMGISFHCEEQFMDAPTMAGGVNRYLKDQGCYTVMDIGGDDIGARAVGGFAPQLNRDDTSVYYVINPYRPWSGDMDHIDWVLSAILGVSHIRIENIHLISNPNLGNGTGPEQVIKAQRALEEMVLPYKPIEFLCVREELYETVKENAEIPVLPLHLYLTYSWLM